MGNNYINKEIIIGNKKYYYALMNGEKDDNVIKIIKSFPNGIKEKESETLIPQPWWGNIENPKIIVLAKNPSYLDSDDEYNRDPDFRNVLDKNLSATKRDQDLYLSSLFYNFKEKQVFKTWKKYLRGYKERNFNLDEIGIFNMFGYYRTHLDDYELKNSHINTISQVRKTIIDKILNDPEKVFLLWEGTRNNWLELLLEEKNIGNIEEFKNKYSQVRSLNKRFNASFKNLK